MRRTIARYLIVALIQTLRMTSVQVKKRFPTLKHLSDAGIITDSERIIIESLDEKCIQHPKYWMSLVWAGAVVTRAKKEGRIKDDFAFRTIIKEINNFRSGCGGLLDYDWISIPLVYTQVVTLAVYTFFLSSLMGRQFLDPSKGLAGHDVDLVVPVFTFLQFFFYMGWLKVAEVLINPFGEDDDDFEMNWLIDRNLQVAYLIVDDMHAEHPELVKDQFWDEGIPDELPYTLAAEECRPAEPWLGSTADVIVSAEQGEFVHMDKIDEDVDSESDNELRQVRVEDVKPTGPVHINNGKLTSRGSVSTLQESMGERRESNNSMMKMLRKVFTNAPTRSTSRLNVNGIGSLLSVNSKVSNADRKPRRRKLSRTYKTGLQINMSKASHLSTENLSPGLSRVPTHECDIFKMSDTSSVNSLNTESEFPTRRNSDAKALLEVRELLRNDLQRYHGTVKIEENLDNVDGKESRGSNNSRQIRTSVAKQKRKDNRNRAENLAHTAMLKRKLEQVQALQVQIMKALDDDIKQHSNLEEFAMDTEDAVNLLELKTNELKNSLRYRRQAREAQDVTDMDTETPTSPVHDQSENVLKPFKVSRNQSFSLDMGSERGNFTSPNSPVPLEHFQANPLIQIQPISPAVSNNSNISHFTGSNPSIGDELFIFDCSNDKPDEEKQENTSGEDSETPSVIANPNSLSYLEEESSEKSSEKLKKDDQEDYYGEPWDNLGTIHELPELGYQSDSSDTDLLIPKTKQKSIPRNESDSSDTTLPTVHEEQIL